MNEPTYATPTFRSVADVRAANIANGGHFFDADTLRFFGSRLTEDVYGGRYFVTSERDPHGDAWNGERRYTIREAYADGDVRTVGEFGAYRTLAAAKRAARELAR